MRLHCIPWPWLDCRMGFSIGSLCNLPNNKWHRDHLVDYMHSVMEAVEACPMYLSFVDCKIAWSLAGG